MIFDKIENWGRYFKNQVFTQIFEQLKSYSVDTIDGIYKSNSGFYFKVMEYETKLLPKIIESHRKEVDIQIVLRGKEKIKIYNEESVEISQEYNRETDCIFYEERGAPHTEINLIEGYMAVFFPEDIHYPQFSVDQHPSRLKKIVIKVDEKLFA